MTPRDHSSLLRLWWAGPTTMAVAAGLAFAVGFAPRLADRVTLPHEVAVAPPVHHTQAVPSRSRVSHAGPVRTKAHPAPTPTIAAPSSGGDSNGGTVVVPARPVVTSGTADDERWSSTSASPTPRESGSQRDSGGDG